MGSLEEVYFEHYRKDLKVIYELAADGLAFLSKSDSTDHGVWVAKTRLQEILDIVPADLRPQITLEITLPYETAAKLKRLAQHRLIKADDLTIYDLLDYIDFSEMEDG